MYIYYCLHFYLYKSAGILFPAGLLSSTTGAGLLSNSGEEAG